MYRVLFAEDELLVRLGLQNSIPWEEFSMELVALADNGATAFKLFKECHPDVVITDIRMDGMDGCELIRRIREIDGECAIVVISCLDDFETLRKMISYQIIGYILKAGMQMEEVHSVLREVKEYLVRIGRTGREPEKANAEGMGSSNVYRLLKDSGAPVWDEGQRMREMLIFEPDREEEDKVSGLAMKFIYELVQRQAPDAEPAELEEKSFCLFWPEGAGEVEEQAGRLIHSIHGFLGVKFHRKKGSRKGTETLREWYFRLQREEDAEKPEEKQWDATIRKAVRYMREHHCKVLRLADISGVVGMSDSYFSYLFKKETGSNYVEFLNKIRLEEVLKELCVSDEKISFIAEAHGFHNQEYFWRYFKKNMGVSPAKWRQENR